MTQLPSHLEDRVRALAHSLWLEEGMPHGRDEAHWFKALELVNAEAQPAAKLDVQQESPAKPKRKAAAATARKPAARKSPKA